MRAAGNRGGRCSWSWRRRRARVLQTLNYGHPEDLLATAGAVGAVLVARSGRTTAAAALLVLAIVAKQWAVLAILPPPWPRPAAAEDRRRRRARDGGAARAADAPDRSGAHAGITNTGLLFHPHQLFWPFGMPATPEFIAAGHGTRMGPAG